MSLLYSVCGERYDPLVREVPLSEPAHIDVMRAFYEQEERFREGIEVAFEENWLNDGGEIATTIIPPDISVFSIIEGLSDTIVEPVSAEDITNIRALAVKADEGGKDRILVQSFAAGQSLSRPWLVSLLFEDGTYTRLETSGFRLDNKLVCIIEDGLIKFRSLHNLGRVIDTSTIFKAASDSDVESFAAAHKDLFEITNLEEFVNNTSRNARKYINSLTRSQSLEQHNAQSLQVASAGTKLQVKIENNKIVMPSDGGEITELMRFLNDGRYVGPISGKAYITNSRRPVT